MSKLHFKFMIRTNFMLMWAENEKSFITLWSENLSQVSYMQGLYLQKIANKSITRQILHWLAIDANMEVIVVCVLNSFFACMSINLTLFNLICNMTYFWNSWFLAPSLWTTPVSYQGCIKAYFCFQINLLFIPFNIICKMRYGNKTVSSWCELILCMLGNFSCFCCRLLTFFQWLFFKLKFFKKFFQEHYQSVKQLGSRSVPTFCLPWFESKLFAKVISRWQVSPSKERVKTDAKGIHNKDKSDQHMRLLH